MSPETIGERFPLTRSFGVRLLAVTLAYMVAGKLGLALATVHPSATAVWAPTGIALASLLVLGVRLWPAILVGAFVVNVTTAGAVGTSLLIAVGNTLEAVVGALLVQRFARGKRAFDHAPDVFKFALFAGLLSTLISTACGVTALALGGQLGEADLRLVVLTWWLGDAGGALVVAPALILCSLDRSFRWVPERSVESAALIFSLWMVSTTVFMGWLPLGFTAYPLAFLTVPVLVWAAYRFGPREVALSFLVIATAAIWGTLRGEGPFVRGSVHESLLLIQVFLGTMSVTKLALSALVAERRRVQEAVLVGYAGLGIQFRRQRADLIGALQDLEREVNDRKLAEQKVRDFNLLLERRVRERTTQLRRSNQLLQQFASHAAHDLREPLRTVGSYTDLLRRRYQGRLDQDAEDFMGHITGGVMWMGALIDALLTYASVGTTALRRTTVDAQMVLAQALTNLELVIAESRAVVTHDPLPMVRGDSTQLVLLFQNLIGNAIKFRGSEPPRVHVAAARVRRRLCFTVRDNGLGMDPRQTQRIFAVFQRLNDREEYPGTGIGLAVCRKIVERHRGRIWAESRPGEGSVFHFTLPAARGSNVASVAREPDGRAERTSATTPEVQPAHVIELG